MRAVLAAVEHRPWPLPTTPWVLSQTWEQLLFMHWPVPADSLRPLLPRGLELELFDGTAWLGIVPFRMAWVRPRALPAVPALSFFPELNVRTYVRQGDAQGVWFLSLDAGSRVAVRVARRFFRLPYFDAEMRVGVEPEHVTYASRRVHRGAPPADFEATYAPSGGVRLSRPGTLEHWLTERYCLFAADTPERLHRADIHHRPWPLQPAEAETPVNTMALGHGIRLPPIPPLLHYARSISVATWPLRLVAGAAAP